MSDTATAYDPAPLASAMQAIRASCDRARRQDGVGFGKFDKDLGYRLAETPPSEWSPKMVAAAHRLAIKYRKQLAGLGIDAEAIAAPPEEVTAKRRKATWTGREFFLSFDYDAALVDDVKRVQGARLQRTPNVGWLIPLGSKPQLKIVLERHGFDLAEDVARAMSATKADHRPNLSAAVARVCDIHPHEPEALTLRFPDHRGCTEEARQIAAWSATAKRWRVPLLNEERLTALRHFLNVWRFHVTDEAQQRIETVMASRRQTFVASRAVDGAIDVPGLVATLRGFQATGVRYVLERMRTFVADEMGLGKTIQAIASMLAARAFPCVVICPASLKLNWFRELRKFAPGVSVEVLDSRRRRMTMADVVIINYDILGAHLDEIERRAPRMLVFDEAHAVKSFKAQRTKWARTAARTADYVLMLTGTPVLNRPAELIAPLDIMRRLNDVGGYGYFKRRFCEGDAFNPTGGAHHLEELNDMLRGICYIRRMKRDVLTELPPKTRAAMVLPIDNRAEYDHAEAELISWLRAQVRKNAEFLKSLEGMTEAEREAAIGNEQRRKELAALRAEQLVKTEALKQVAARGMLAAALAWIRDFVESGEKLIVFGTHIEIVKAVAAEFDAPIIIGETPIPDRQAAVDRFQTNPACKVIAMNMQAGGVGLTLTAASNVAFLELGWTPGLHDQAEDRAHRIGQRDAVTAWYLLAEGTIYEPIAAKLDEKRDVVNRATDGTTAETGSVFADILAKLQGPGPRPPALDSSHFSEVA